MSSVDPPTTYRIGSLVASGKAREVSLFARQRPIGALSALVIVIMGIIATAGPVIAPFDPDRQVVGMRYAKPFTQFVLGGDEFGRDILSRIMVGARVSLIVGFSATALAGVSGLILGIFSGYFGGKVDLLVQRLIDTLQAFPGLVLAMVFVVALGPSPLSVVIAVAVPSVPLSTRVTRSVALQVTQLDYVTAAEAVGAGVARIMWRHILPQTIAPFIVIFSIGVGQAIVTEATLGFIGLGVPPPTATWGGMLSQASKAFFLAPWVAIFPGLALSITVFAVNLFGDAMRDTLDPRLRGT
jgi:peptide/nickel transport system permease protein